LSWQRGVVKRRHFFSGVLASLLGSGHTRLLHPPATTIFANSPEAPYITVLLDGKPLSLVKAVNVREGWAEIYLTDYSGKLRWDDKKNEVESAVIRGNLSLCHKKDVGSRNRSPKPVCSVGSGAVTWTGA